MLIYLITLRQITLNFPYSRPITQVSIFCRPYKGINMASISNLGVGSGLPLSTMLDSLTTA
ncbi:hypothetical protein GKC49_29670, partial [Pantoea agglomerans]|nr:hypothetical protein [Pantoea agglomerans]